MNPVMFIVGFVIFAAYIYLTIWSIFYNNKKQQEENYPQLDGMGNYKSKRKIGNDVLKWGNVSRRTRV